MEKDNFVQFWMTVQSINDSNGTQLTEQTTDYH